MRTSLNEIAANERFLQGEMNPEDALLFEANTLLNASLAADVSTQQQSYKLVRQYGRQQLKAELESVHQKLFSQSRYRAFAEGIKRMFNLH